MLRTVVVSRHRSFVAYLKEIGLAPHDAEVLEHVEKADIRGAHVIGILPPHLAAEAMGVTAVPLHLSLEQRERKRKTGQDLDIQEIREAAGKPYSYRVIKT